jgi:uncharacterized protein (DUF2164 family)
MSGMRIDPERRGHLVDAVRGFWLEEFDEELSPFRAEKLLDFVVQALGPQVYNQGVQDARKFLQERLDDLDGEVYEPDTTR